MSTVIQTTSTELRTHPLLFGCVLLCAFGSPLAADRVSLTYTGASGVLSTPDALIANPGTFVYQYNDFMESRFEGPFVSGNNHVFTLGVFDRLELGGRLTDFEPEGAQFSPRGTLNGKRDLSGNFKLNLYAFDNRYFISAGAMDFGGLAQNFKSAYGVGTARWGNSWFSVGAATGDNPSFDGVFANARYQFNPYVSLAAEIDTTEAIQVGVSGRLPLSERLAVTGTLSGGDAETRIALGFSYSLMASKPSLGVATVEQSKETTPNQEDSEANANLTRLSNLGSALQAAGFQNVRKGITGAGSFLIEVENRLYTHSQFDALAAVKTIASAHLPATSVIEISLLERRQKKFRVALHLDTGVTSALSPLPTPNELADVTWVIPVDQQQRSLADFTIQPALVTAVGTEYGVIDYSFAARLGVSVHLWTGAKAVLNTLLPLASSENFEPGKPFARRAFEASVERAMLVQYFPPVNSIHSQLELGQVQLRGFDYTTIKAQAAWQSTQQPVLLHLRAGQFRLNDSNIQRNVFLSSAAYTFNSWDTELRATYGQFFFGEHGVRLDATRRFGDSFVSLFLKVIESDDLAGGLLFSTPIGPRKGLQWNRFTLTGSSRWSHGLQTTIKFPDASDNRLQPFFLMEPLTDSDIPTAVLDSSRLGPFWSLQDF